ncbi:MAG: hypothetical protein O3C19_04570 [Bacteroidetes bacterium]|nr:hypothetical protein [Bacteroidota bacterium]
MAQSGITLDITSYLDKFNKLAKDMPFLISKSMNDVAFQDSRKQLSQDMEKNLIIRSKNIKSLKMFQIEKSTKTDLKVEIKHKILNLGLQQFGGVEKGKLAIPNRENMALFLGVPNKKVIPPSLRIKTIMKRAPRSRSEARRYKVKSRNLFILDTGVFMRVGNDIKAVYHFVDEARHTKKGFDMQSSVEFSYNKRFSKRFNVNYLKELRR